MGERLANASRPGPDDAGALVGHRGSASEPERRAPRTAAIRVRRYRELGGTGLLAPRNRAVGPAVPELGIGELVALCASIDLRGRGGAGFPLARKLSAVREAAFRRGRSPRVVVNGEEGEPGSVKDRALLTLCPDLVLDGARLVAQGLGAEKIHLYVGAPDCRRILERRIALRGESAAAEVFAAPSGYVSGEETAVVRALSGGPAKPTAKPPRPFDEGVEGLPTLVSNVETLAHLADAVRWGTGAPSSSRTAPGGSVLLTVSTDLGEKTLVEAPAGIQLREVLERLSVWPATGRPDVILGGFYGSFVPPAGFTAPLVHQSMRDIGLSLGCGAVMVLTDLCPVSAVAEILHYLDLENAHQCGPCFRGIPSMSDAVEALAGGTATVRTLEQLRSWSVSLRGRGACGTLDAAAGLVASLLDRHGDLAARHMDSTCANCHGNVARPPASRWSATWPCNLEED